MILPSVFRKSKQYLSILFLLSLLSCAKEKDTTSSRLYHSTTSYFNGYYNADQIMKQVITDLEDNYVFPEQGYIEVIYYGTEQEAESQKASLQQIIEKNDAVIFKHPNGQYIDNCRFLNGQAWFYQRDYRNAMTNFDYVLSEFPDSKLTPEIWFWKAKAFYFDGNPEMTFSVLDEYFINSDTFDLSANLEGELGIFRTRLAIEQGEYKQAAQILENAIPNIDGTERKNRASYLLGQLYASAGEGARATEQFEYVARKTNNYDLSFSAKMQVAKLYAGEGGIREDDLYDYMDALLKDEKNIEYQDQIYYQYAKLSQDKGKKTEAVDYYNRSVRASTNNARQKALSYFELGKIYFADQNYDNAQAYYDSAAVSITEESLEYKEITGLAKTLKEYITYKNTIHYQDSMLVLADMSPEEQDRVVNQIVAKELERERKEQQALLASMQNNDPNYNPMLNQQNQQRNRAGNQAGTAWYFDNPSAVSQGKIQFQQQWGQRKDEDNWRRSQKALSFANGEDAEAANAEVDSALIEKYGDKAKYYQNIPKDEDEKNIAYDKIEDALYSLAQLYSSQLNEPDSARKTYEDLLQRYPEGEYELQSHYALFKLYQAKGNNRANRHKQYILNNHPNTVYALLLQGIDPRELRKQEEEFKYAYKGVFTAFSNKQYETTIGFSEFLLAQANDFQNIAQDDMARVHYMRGMSYGYTGEQDSLRNILTRVIQAYPEAEVTPKAQKTLDLLNKLNPPPAGGRAGTAASPNATVPGREAGPGNPMSETPAANAKNGVDPNNPKYAGFSAEKKSNDKVFVLMYIDKNKISKSEATTQVSNFNATNYKEKNLKVFTFLYKQTHLLPYISHFPSIEEAKAYIAGFQTSGEGSTILQSGEEKIFYITHSNFKIAYGQKRMTDYIEFYTQVLEP
ncbi:MAG: tetratricopeptide repeat protein [Bacteroidota bacterium]